MKYPIKDFMSVDPGNKKSGWLRYKLSSTAVGGIRIVDHGVEENDILFLDCTKLEHVHLAIETPKPRGMPTAAEEMDTLIFAGGLTRMWGYLGIGPWSMVFRQDVKVHLCGAAQARDVNVRQALIDRFGGDTAMTGLKCSACKGKGWLGRGRQPCPACNGSKWEQAPGELYGFASHAWSALAVACYWADKKPMIHEITLPVELRKPKKGRKNREAVGLESK